MKKKSASATERQIAALRQTCVDLKARLDADTLANATPALTIAAAEGSLLIVACEGISLRLRTRSVTVSTLKV